MNQSISYALVVLRGEFFQEPLQLSKLFHLIQLSYPVNLFMLCKNLLFTNLTQMLMDCENLFAVPHMNPCVLFYNLCECLPQFILFNVHEIS